MIGSNGDHVCGCWEWGAVARIATPHLDLGMRAILVTLDEHQIAWRQARKQILEGGLIRFPKLMHDRPAPWRHEQNFRGTSLTMAPAVGSVVIDVGVMMRAFDGRDLVASCCQLRDEALGQGRLAAVLPACNADYGWYGHVNASRFACLSGDVRDIDARRNRRERRQQHHPDQRVGARLGREVGASER